MLSQNISLCHIMISRVQLRGAVSRLTWLAILNFFLLWGVARSLAQRYPRGPSPSQAYPKYQHNEVLTTRCIVYAHIIRRPQVARLQSSSNMETGPTKRTRSSPNL